jgi:AcrR family transcriptional regulator
LTLPRREEGSFFPVKDPTWLYEAAVGDLRGYATVTRDSGAQRGVRARQAQTAILAAAWRLFEEKDYDSITMDDLAKQAGVSRPSLYSYYHSKRSIFLAIAIAVNARFQASARAFLSLEIGEPLLTDLRTWVKNHLIFLKETFWTSVLWDRVVIHDDRLRAEGVRQESQAWNALGEHVLRLRGSPGGNSLAEGMVVLAMLERCWFYWSLSDGPFPFDELIDTTTATVAAIIGLPTSTLLRSSIGAEAVRPPKRHRRVSQGLDPRV